MRNMSLLLAVTLGFAFTACTHAPTPTASNATPPEYSQQYPLTTYEDAYWMQEADAREPSNAAGDRCAEKVRQAGCYMSNNDLSRIASNVRDCKQFSSSTTSINYVMQVFLMKKSGTIVTVQTKPLIGSGNCNRIKYDFGANTNIVEIKGIAGRIIARATTGQVFFLGKNGAFYELLNSKGVSYSNVSNIEGKDATGATSNQHLTLTFAGNQKTTFSANDLDLKINGKNQAKAVYFFNYSNNRSLFRDEDVQ